MLSWNILGGEEVLAYASDHQVTVFTSCGREVSTLQMDKEVHCMAWCRKDGRLAVGTEGQVHVYRPYSPSAASKLDNVTTFSRDVEFQLKATLDLGDAVSSEYENGADPALGPPSDGEEAAPGPAVPTCIDWNVMGDKLVVGQGLLALWEDSALRPPKRDKDAPSWRVFRSEVAKPTHEAWEKVMERRQAGPISSAAYGPDGRLCATVAEGTKEVLVWFVEVLQPKIDPTQNYDVYPEATSRFSSLTLRHPFAVCSLAWLRKDMYRGHGSTVLMTLAEDGVIRIWTESSMPELLTFHLCNAINGGCTGGMVRWLETPYNLGPQSHLLDYALEHKKAGLATEMEKASTAAGHPITHKCESLPPYPEAPGVVESQSWVLLLDPSGTISVYLVQGLADLPRRTPKVLLTHSLPGVIPTKHRFTAGVFYYDPLINCAYSPAHLPPSYLDPQWGCMLEPQQLTLLLKNKHALEKWVINTERDSVGHRRMVFANHAAAVVCVIAHPIWPLLATLDARGLLIVWLWPESSPTEIKSKWSAGGGTSHGRGSDSRFLSIAYLDLTLALSPDDTPVVPTHAAFLPQSPPFELLVAVQGSSTPVAVSIAVADLDVSALGPEQGDKQAFALPGFDGGGGHGIYCRSLPTSPSLWRLNVTQGPRDMLPSVPLCLSAHPLPWTSSGHCYGVALAVDDQGSLMMWAAARGSAVEAQSPSTLAAARYPQSECRWVSLQPEGPHRLFGEVEACLHAHASSPGIQAFVPEDGDTEGAPAQRVARAAVATASGVTLFDLRCAVGPGEWRAECARLYHIPYAHFTGQRFGAESTDITAMYTYAGRLLCIAFAGCPKVAVLRTYPHVWKWASALAVPVDDVAEDPVRSFLVSGPLGGKDEPSGVTFVYMQTARQVHVFASAYDILEFEPSSSLYSINPSTGWHLAKSYPDLPAEPTCGPFATVPYLAGMLGSPFVGLAWAQGRGVTAAHLDIRNFIFRPRLVDYHPTVVIQWLLRGQPEMVQQVIDKVLEGMEPHRSGNPAKGMLGFDHAADLGMYRNRAYAPTEFFNVSFCEIEDHLKVPDQGEAAAGPQSAQETVPNASQFEDAKDEGEPAEAQAAGAAAAEEEEDQVQQLIGLLGQVSLPGLSSAQQMQLVVVLQTFGEFQAKPDALDTCALRYLVQVKLRQHQVHTMSAEDRDKARLSSSSFAWAFQSDTQDALCDMHLANPADVVWPNIRNVGMPYWIKTVKLLRDVAERIAKQQFAATKDPRACALMYVAMKRVSTLAALFKARGQEKLFEFFSRNFRDPKNQGAAEKNAYVSRGKGNFQYAAAFFLLANKPREAIKTLVDDRAEDDWPLGLFVARLYGDEEVLNWLLAEMYYISDPWLKNLVLWHQKRYQDAMKVLFCNAQLDMPRAKQLFKVAPPTRSQPILALEHQRAAQPLGKFDPTLYDYASHVYQRVPQLAHSPQLFNQTKAALLMLTARFFAEAACPSRALAYLQLFFREKKQQMGSALEAEVETQQQEQQEQQQAALDSGTMNFFGGGMMGMGMGMGMGADPAPAAPQTATDSGTMNFFGGGMMGMGMGMGMGADPAPAAPQTATDSGTMNFFGGGMMGMGMGMGAGADPAPAAPQTATDSGTMNFFGGGMMGMGMGMGAGADPAPAAPQTATDSGTMNFFGGGMMGMGMGMGAGADPAPAAPQTATDSGTMNFFGGGMMGMGMGMGAGADPAPAAPQTATDSGTMNFFGGGMMGPGGTGGAGGAPPAEPPNIFMAGMQMLGPGPGTGEGTATAQQPPAAPPPPPPAPTEPEPETVTEAPEAKQLSVRTFALRCVYDHLVLELGTLRRKAASTLQDFPWAAQRERLVRTLGYLRRCFDLDLGDLLPRLVDFCGRNGHIVAHALLVEAERELAGQPPDALALLPMLTTAAHLIHRAVPQLVLRPGMTVSGQAAAIGSTMLDLSIEYALVWAQWLALAPPADALAQPQATELALAPYVGMFAAAWVAGNVSVLYALLKTDPRLLRRDARAFLADVMAHRRHIDEEVDTQWLVAVDEGGKRLKIDTGADVAWQGLVLFTWAHRLRRLLRTETGLHTALSCSLYLLCRRTLPALATHLLYQAAEAFSLARGASSAFDRVPYPVIQCLACPTIAQALPATGEETHHPSYLDLGFLLMALETQDPLQAPVLPPGDMDRVFLGLLPEGEHELPEEDGASHAQAEAAGAREKSWMYDDSEFRNHAAMQALWTLCDQYKGARGFGRAWDGLTRHLVGPHPGNPPTLRFAARHYELYHHSALVSTLCIDKSNPNIIAVAIRNGVREINVAQSLRFRKRSDSRTRLLDPEVPTWQEALHRFDGRTEASPSEDAGDPASSILRMANEDAASLATTASAGTRDPASPMSPLFQSDWRAADRPFGASADSLITPTQSPPSGAPSSGTASARAAEPALSLRIPPAPKSPGKSPPTTSPLPPVSPLADSGHVDEWWTKRTRNLYRRHKTLVHSIVSDTEEALSSGGGSIKDMGSFVGSDCKKKWTIFQAQDTETGVDHDQKVRWLESHPFLPFYLTGGTDGAVHMFQFGLARSVRTYRQPNQAQVSHIHFTNEGYKFGVTDYTGSLLLWRFEANPGSVNPYMNFQPHSTVARDFAFLDSGSMIATIGSSDSSYHLRLFDTLLPQSQRLVHEMPIDNEPTCIVYSTVQQDLLFATKRGEVISFDLRQRKVRHTVKAHEKNIKTIALSPGDTYLATGGLDGDVKVWDVQQMNLHSTFLGLHPAHKSLGGAALVSTYGVTGTFFTHDYLYSCGADGRVVRVAYHA